MTLPQAVYLFEFKCNQSAAVALAQMRERDYAARYRGAGKQITLVGVNFSAEQRIIAGWCAEPDTADSD